MTSVSLALPPMGLFKMAVKTGECFRVDRDTMASFTRRLHLICDKRRPRYTAVPPHSSHIPNRGGSAPQSLVSPTKYMLGGPISPLLLLPLATRYF